MRAAATRALAKALGQMKPQDVVKEVTASGLQGRGGAAFAVGRKWQVVAVRRRPAALPDRQCRRRRAGHVQGPLDPREQPARAARVDADRELRAQRPQLLRLHPRRVRPALPPPRGRGRGSLRGGLFGERTSSASDFSCDIVVYRGAGAYVAGEASGLISSLEGKKGYPRNRPPRLTVKGLYQRPTVVNNVESLSNIAWIISNGADGLQGRRHAQEPGHAPLLGVRATSTAPASTKSNSATRG